MKARDRKVLEKALRQTPDGPFKSRCEQSLPRLLGAEGDELLELSLAMMEDALREAKG